MPESAPHIAVCICTLNRPALLKRLLDRLAGQETGGRFTYSVVVADNDAARSAEAIVAEAASRSPVEIHYASEPRRNIALARNTALRHAHGDFAAFIDDDEFPEPGWLAAMLGTCEAFGVAGVLGPVRPHFEEPPPQWIIDGRFCERPEYPTGRVMPWDECRTGNVLFRRDLVEDAETAFDPAFGTGGEDKDFFMRMTGLGHVFLWCNEGVVYETVPKDRWTRGYMLRRALLRGQNIIKHPVGKVGLVARSLVATPVYLAVLPFAYLRGQHVFMKYCIKLCDHVGRILAVVGLNPVVER